MKNIKPCPKCGTKHSSKQSYCPACMREYRKQWRSKTTNRKKATEQSAAWKRRNPTKVKASGKVVKIRQKYGLNRDDYLGLIARQNGACPICGGDLDPWSADTCVDHCHVSGAVRGVLHDKCNRLLSCAEDSVDRLSSAMQYLQDYGAGCKPLMSQNGIL